MSSLKRRDLLPIVGGILLVVAGVIFLLENLGIFALEWGMLIGPIFGVGGLAFLLVFILNKDQWWALIPGFVLIAIGINIFMSEYMGALADRWGGAVFLGSIGLAFIVIYIFHNEHWWAIIPGGVLLTLAGVTLIPGDGILSGGAFFIGLALTFSLVYLLPKPSGRLNWALYPAGILFLMGVAVILGARDLLNYVWPVVLLVAGVIVLFKAIQKR